MAAGESSTQRALRGFGRALLLRCPRCGGANLFAWWLQPRRRCPRCELLIEGEAGGMLGSMAINIGVSGLLWAVGLAAIMIATWPSPPVELLRWGSVAWMIVFPLLFFPWAKTLWLALDLLVKGDGERRV